MVADLGTYTGTSAPDFEYGNGGQYSKMFGKGGGDFLGSSLKLKGEFVKIYGDGGGDNLSYYGAGKGKLDGGKGDDYLYGGDRNDKLIGGKGDDWLFGNLGNDWLKGHKGNDHFAFNTTPDSKKNKDEIDDFQLGKDLIHINQFTFQFNYNGWLKKKNFEKGKKADDGNDYIGYHKKSGTLWWDPNGDDKGGKEEFACVEKGLKLSYHDFMID